MLLQWRAVLRFSGSLEEKGDPVELMPCVVFSIVHRARKLYKGSSLHRALRVFTEQVRRERGGSAFDIFVPLLLHGWPTSVHVLFGGLVRSRSWRHLILMIHYILKAMHIILYQSCKFSLNVFFICRTFFCFKNLYTCNYMLISVVEICFCSCYFSSSWGLDAELLKEIFDSCLATFLHTCCYCIHI